MKKIRRKTLVGQQMYGLLLGGSYNYFSPPTPDTTDPIISNIQVINITETEATITWDTDEPSTSVVDYGLTSGYGTQVSNGSLVTSHVINITGLTSDTLYHFQVTSVDGSSNSASSADDTFNTEAPAEITTNALANDASGDFAQRTAGAFVGPTTFSILFAIRLDDDALSGLRVSCMMRNGDDNYLAVLATDALTYGWWRQDISGEANVGLSTALAEGVWYWFAATCAGNGAGQTTLYRRQDGTGSWTSTTTTCNFTGAFTSLTVLSNFFNTGAGWFPGRIHGLRIWSDVKTGNELLAESLSPTTVITTNLHEEHNMDQASVANAMLDGSGNARNLTANGSMSIQSGPTYTP